ncbi:putative arginase [Papiliotrema laurentii]|uniref:Arginase n=1 Tax=Papiliotrema laurentii TaxID=5418 RepID=A0AAD9L8M4_PAPLA|nr:putative arginase [Papiliotrema laurentii]
MLRQAIAPIRVGSRGAMGVPARSVWTKAHKEWRADTSPTSTISASPTNGTKTPKYKYKFLSEPATTEIIGIPFSGGQPRAGVDLGPNRLISAGLINQIAGLGWNVKYNTQQTFLDNPYNPVQAGEATEGGRKVLPDPDIGKMKKPRLVSAVCEKVAEKVGGIAEKGWLPLTLGGDHSLGLGTVAGTKSRFPDAKVIWVDAHADINTPLTTDTGNLHGCPVSFLLGLTGCDVEPFNKWVKPCLKPEDLVFIGLRDVDPAEKELLRENGIKAFSMHEVDRYGIGKVVELALQHVNPNGDKPIHLSFDVDAMDPTVAPSTGTPVRGGLTFREGHYITEAVAETGCLVGIDIMEVNPSLLDPVSIDQTVAVGCSLARAAMGETLL